MTFHMPTELADHLGIEFDKNDPPDPIAGWIKRESVTANRIWAEITKDAVTFRAKSDSTTEHHLPPVLRKDWSEYQINLVLSQLKS